MRLAAIALLLFIAPAFAAEGLREALNRWEADKLATDPLYPAYKPRLQVELAPLRNLMSQLSVDDAVMMVEGVYMDIRLPAGECREAARARRDLKDAANEVVNCASAAGDDCSRQVRDVRNAGDDLESAVSSCD